jgi:predicted nucleic acid-binding protein
LEQAVTLVDSNVLIDLLQDDPTWGQWSEDHLFGAQSAGPIAINTVIYAELVPTVDSKTTLDAFLKTSRIDISSISRDTAFLAGQVFLRYRRQKGTKTGVLADFFIGAQAQTEGLKILTRDAGRYRTYFPSVKLICPKV